MAVVTQQERKKQLANQQKFVDGIPKMEDYAEADIAENLTIRERLLRRLDTNTVNVPFSDDLGEFNIEIRLMSPKEQGHLMKLYSKLASFLKTKTDEDDTERAEELLDQGTEMLTELYQLAGYLCVDPSLNAEFWKEGSGFNIDVPLTIIRTALSESQKVQKQTAKFRKK